MSAYNNRKQESFSSHALALAPGSVPGLAVLENRTYQHLYRNFMSSFKLELFYLRAQNRSNCVCLGSLR